MPFSTALLARRMSVRAVMNSRRFFALLTLIAAGSLYTLVYINRDIVKSIAFATFYKSESNVKTILYWNKFFKDDKFFMGEGYIAQHCPRYKNCLATHLRSLKDVDNFDAIVFHGINGELDDTDVPIKRNSNQKYIFVALESPANRYINREFDDYFNLTMTYRLDSDIIWTYADIIDNQNKSAYAVPSKQPFLWHDKYVEVRNDERETRLTKLIRGKRKLAVWYRSNCNTRGGREVYVEELQNHMSVNKFGKCSNNQGCPRDEDCFKTEVEPNYFFYLSFENSLCDDYVTEKFFDALKYDVVPVVYGGANYSRFAPPKSYVNALDFDTPKDLAKYLIRLSHNMTEYKKYFEWKKHYLVVSAKRRIICDLCEILNNEDKQKKYTISKWYSLNSCPLQHKLDKQIVYGGSSYATKKTFNIH